MVAWHDERTVRARFSVAAPLRCQNAARLAFSECCGALLFPLERCSWCIVRTSGAGEPAEVLMAALLTVTARSPKEVPMLRSWFALFMLTITAVACGGSDESELAEQRQFLTRCDGSFTPPPRTGFRHFANRHLALRPAWHPMQDVVIAPANGTTVEGKFAYGSLSKDLEREQVQLFIHDCTGWRSVGTADTDSDGRARIALTAPTGPGMYSLKMVVRGDATSTPGYLVVPPRGSRLTVFDIDGTLTTSDMELVKDVFTDLFEPILHGTYPPTAYPVARELVAERERRGGVPIFLTGRPYWLTQSSRDWLAAGRFPTGGLHTTNSNGEALPTGVASYKTAFLRSLLAKGFAIEAAYGNATTDIEAYDAAGIPKDATYIIGSNGGKDGTHGACAINKTCKSWEEEVRRLVALP